jgi:hypothetical protein
MDKVQGITPLENAEELKQALTVLGNGVLQETMNLWYEVSYLRFVLAEVINCNPEIAKNFTAECTVRAQKLAQEHLKKIYNNPNLTFTDAQLLIQNKDEVVDPMAPICDKCE